MLEFVLATLLSACAPDRAVSFEDAKANASKRMAYVAQLLDAQVFDKDKNPNGMIKAWYFVADDKQMAEAQDAIKARYKTDGREFYFNKDIKSILAPLASMARRAIPWYSDNVGAGSGSKSGIVLVGDLFSLQSDAEARSVIEDFVLPLVKLREAGLKVKDDELDANIPALKLVSNKSLLSLFAQAGQLEAILKGTRKVSDAFRKDVTEQYLATLSLYDKMFGHEKKVYDDNNENTLQKEIVDFLDSCYKFNQERFETLGYKQSLVNKEDRVYSFEKK